MQYVNTNPHAISLSPSEGKRRRVRSGEVFDAAGEIADIAEETRGVRTATADDRRAWKEQVESSDGQYVPPFPANPDGTITTENPGAMPLGNLQRQRDDSVDGAVRAPRILGGLAIGVDGAPPAGWNTVSEADHVAPADPTLDTAVRWPTSPDGYDHPERHGYPPVESPDVVGDGTPQDQPGGGVDPEDPTGTGTKATAERQPVVEGDRSVEQERNTTEGAPGANEDVPHRTENVTAPSADDEPKDLDDMTVDELRAEAQQRGVDLGRASSADGIRTKIREAEDSKAPGTDTQD